MDFDAFSITYYGYETIKNDKALDEHKEYLQIWEPFGTHAQRADL